MKINFEKVEKFVEKQDLKLQHHKDPNIGVLVAGNAIVHNFGFISGKCRVFIGGILQKSLAEFKKNFKK